MLDLVLYTTGFCAPCRAARQVINYASKTMSFNVTEINASDYPDQALKDGVTSTPTLIARTDSGEHWRFIGVPKLSELRRVLANPDQRTTMQ